MTFHHTSKQLGKLPQIHPEPFKKYRQFADDIWQKGIISSHDKEIIAVAVTTITKCSYCTQFHSKKAAQLGVIKEVLIEAIIVATAIEAGTTLMESWSTDLFGQLGNESLSTDLRDTYPNSYESLEDLLLVPFQTGSTLLSPKLILLISYACAHALRTKPYIVKLKEWALDWEVSEEQLAEASTIAAALRAGSTIKHIADVLDVFDQRKGSE